MKVMPPGSNGRVEGKPPGHSRFCAAMRPDGMHGHSIEQTIVLLLFALLLVNCSVIFSSFFLSMARLSAVGREQFRNARYPSIPTARIAPAIGCTQMSVIGGLGRIGAWFCHQFCDGIVLFKQGDCRGPQAMEGSPLSAGLPGRLS
ncbi:hypothetical protein [Ralstonia pseudosolanacearum]|uniref:Uncharacterized protein n=3 Tax=Ralstonia TaxID=48736 RepID=A0A0S4U570_RALSL|nr:hypothetical protein KME70_19880 [Ralstonia solanacearum]CUV17173.1 protein of unknown function [Ralstonia solanacearum]CUV32132.1 protein of unknown function [Ralstonia solanacearum]